MEAEHQLQLLMQSVGQLQKQLDDVRSHIDRLVHSREFGESPTTAAVTFGRTWLDFSASHQSASAGRRLYTLRLKLTVKLSCVVLSVCDNKQPSAE